MMTEARIQQNQVCCSQPAADPNYTVCFPAQQVIPDGTTRENPFYDFSNQKSYWTYEIQIDSAPQFPDLSHWDIEMCEELIEQEQEDDFIVERKDNGEFTVITDIDVLSDGDPSIPPTQGPAPIPLLKIDDNQLTGTTVIYRITIQDPEFFNVASEAGTIAIKHGNQLPPGYQIFDESICGNNVLPVPSRNCTRVSNGRDRRRRGIKI